MITDLLSTDGFIIYNKKLARTIGTNPAILLGYLCSEYNFYSNNGQLDKSKKTSNSTKTEKETKNEDKNKATNNKNEVIKVSEESNKNETVVTDDSDGIRVTSIRYTSGATVKKGDNYFKFIAEEEWDVSRIEDVQEAREKLWAKLNAEVDSQIEELNNMN